MRFLFRPCRMGWYDLACLHERWEPMYASHCIIAMRHSSIRCSSCRRCASLLYSVQRRKRMTWWCRSSTAAPGALLFRCWCCSLKQCSSSVGCIQKYIEKIVINSEFHISRSNVNGDSYLRAWSLVEDTCLGSRLRAKSPLTYY